MALWDEIYDGACGHLALVVRVGDLRSLPLAAARRLAVGVVDDRRLPLTILILPKAGIQAIRQSGNQAIK